VVLHDTDIYEGDPDSLAHWQRDENAKAPAENAAIRDAVGEDSNVFTVEPTLESAFEDWTQRIRQADEGGRDG
jgi:hypothetical protein